MTLKEQQHLVLMPSEVPLHQGRCKLLYEALPSGAVVAPPMPAFDSNSQSTGGFISYSVARLLDLFAPDIGVLKRWDGNRVSCDSNLGNAYDDSGSTNHDE